MGVSYVYQSDRNVLQLTVDGILEEHESVGSTARVQDKFDQHPELKLLVDLRTAGLPAAPTSMLAIRDAFYESVGNMVPTALVTAGASSDPQAMLAETKAYIAGAPMQRFEDPETGLFWLEQR